MTWGGANRPITSNKLGIPNRHQGDDGDIQIRQTELGAKIFGKVGGEWYDAPLSIKGVTKYGTNLSSYLSIDSDSMDVYKEDIKVASFSENTTITGGSITLRSSANNDDKFIITADSAKFYDNNNEVASFGANTILEGGTVTIRNTTNNNDKVVLAQDSLKVYDNNTEVASFGADTIIGEVGAGKSNVQITSGAINLRTNTTTKLSLDSSGNVTTQGLVKIETSASVGDGEGLLIDNDSSGYNQIVMGGANNEILMGYNSGGSSPTSDIAGSSKIFMNRQADGSGLVYSCTMHFRDNNTSQFAMGGAEDEWRVATGDDARTEANCAIRIDSSGDIGFRGSVPSAAPNYGASTYSTNRTITGSTSSADTTDILATLIADLISMGILQ